MSSISSITLLKEFNIGDVGVLEEKLITLDVNEVKCIYYLLPFFI